MAVNIFVQSLYTQHFQATWSYDNVDADDCILEAKIQACAFAGRFLIPGFRPAINENIIEHCTVGPFLEVSRIRPVAEELYRCIPSDRPIIQYFVDLYCRTWTANIEDDIEDLANLPHAFTTRAMRRLRQTILSGGCNHRDINRC